MSAIFGIQNFDGRPVLQEHLEQMNQVLAHRGPDGSRLWRENSVGLGHRMLLTTPESLHEQLPLTDKNSDLVMTSDARIDNRDQLVALLGLTVQANDALSDSALILAAYKKWGDRCPERLLGDFVFVVWDGRRQLLVCARDHLGVRPFYFYHQPGKIFAFASEIKALLCLPEVPRRFNEQKVGDFLAGLFDDKSATFYHDIFRLPPAHIATVSDRGLKHRCYWSLDPSAELKLRSDDEYAAAYRETFTEAVRCRLRSAFPVGSHLSGGLDSSSITCVARDLAANEGGRRLQTFSLVFDDVPQSDERPFINAVVNAGGVDPHYIRGDMVTPLTDLRRVLWHQDEPFHGPNLFLNWQVWSVARQHDVRVLLDGIMGDNVVSHGFAYLNELARSWRWIKLTREIRALARQRHVSPWPGVRRYVWNDGIKPSAPLFLRNLLCRFSNRTASDETISTLIDPDFDRRIGLTERLKLSDQAQKDRLRSAKQDHYQELTSGVIPAALEVAANGAGAFNIELRIPFLDRRLVELCLAMPPEQKIHDGRTRVVARRALADRLPSQIRQRVSKGNLGPNFIRGLVSEQAELRRSLFEAPKGIETYVNLSALHALYEKFLEKKGASDDEVSMLFLLAMLSVWRRPSELVAPI